MTLNEGRTNFYSKSIINALKRSFLCLYFCQFNFKTCYLIVIFVSQKWYMSIQWWISTNNEANIRLYPLNILLNYTCLSTAFISGFNQSFCNSFVNFSWKLLNLLLKRTFWLSVKNKMRKIPLSVWNKVLACSESTF